MAPRETENNAYAKFRGDEQRTLWYVMVFSGVVNLESLSPAAAPVGYSKQKKGSNILKNKTIVSVACQQALHLGESRELTRDQK